MFYAWPSRKKKGTLIITNDPNRIRPKRCEGFENFEEIPIHEYENFILLSIPDEILYESLNEKHLLRKYLETHNFKNILRRVYM